MKVFKVTLALFLGEYEKSSIHFVEAETEDKAMYYAFSAETHNNIPTYQEYRSQGDSDWEDDYMIYRVSSCEEVERVHVEALGLHIS